MRGIILAGGTGSRLYPLTRVTNKHLLPVYNKPMIFYPLYAMKSAGITNVLIVSGKGHSGSFLELLGSGANVGMKISYEVQEEAGGIAQALSLAENFANNEKVVVILGDNIFEDSLKEAVDEFKSTPRGARVFLKEVKNPQAYGVADIDEKNIKNIIEKPKNPPSNLAVTGCYMYDPQVFDIIKGLKPSNRNELEITDVNNFYIEQGTLKYSVLNGFWGDGGESFDSLMEAGTLIQNSHLAHVDEHLCVNEEEHAQRQDTEPDREHNSLKNLFSSEAFANKVK
ncbi:spore coat protein [Candidatus Peregrinibacteria bacterium CG_4_10_14_0_2_um_filter_38_24]|nr:MAG: spore coat protein [Candidatus Peregrinibacteria bacterium CG_4_10_14_0_2_um_filter_38_24]